MSSLCGREARSSASDYNWHPAISLVSKKGLQIFQGENNTYMCVIQNRDYFRLFSGGGGFNLIGGGGGGGGQLYLWRKTTIFLGYGSIWTRGVPRIQRSKLLSNTQKPRWQGGGGGGGGGATQVQGGAKQV